MEKDVGGFIKGDSCIIAMSLLGLCRSDVKGLLQK